VTSDAKGGYEGGAGAQFTLSYNRTNLLKTVVLWLTSVNLKEYHQYK